MTSTSGTATSRPTSERCVRPIIEDGTSVGTLLVEAVATSFERRPVYKWQLQNADGAVLGTGSDLEGAVGERPNAERGAAAMLSFLANAAENDEAYDTYNEDMQAWLDAYGSCIEAAQIELDFDRVKPTDFVRIDSAESVRAKAHEFCVKHVGYGEGSGPVSEPLEAHIDMIVSTLEGLAGPRGGHKSVGDVAAAIGKAMGAIDRVAGGRADQDARLKSYAVADYLATVISAPSKGDFTNAETVAQKAVWLASGTIGVNLV